MWSTAARCCCWRCGATCATSAWRIACTTPWRVPGGEACSICLHPANVHTLKFESSEPEGIDRAACADTCPCSNPRRGMEARRLRASAATASTPGLRSRPTPSTRHMSSPHASPSGLPRSLPKTPPPPPHTHTPSTQHMSSPHAPPPPPPPHTHTHASPSGLPRSLPKTPSLFKYMRALVQREPEARDRLLQVCSQICADPDRCAGGTGGRARTLAARSCPRLLVHCLPSQPHSYARAPPPPPCSPVTPAQR